MDVLEIDNSFKEFKTIEEVELKQCEEWSVSEMTLKEIEYNTFFEQFMLRNVPCILKNVSFNWECSNKWILRNQINYEYLIESYGDLVVPVADCNKISYNSQCKCEMKMKDFIHYLRKSERTQLLYLKDWHLKNVRPTDNFYEVPKVFGLDWLNEYAQDNNEDDFRFVYIGPQNSWTPLHSDVYSSYSWSVNVFGRKEWTLFPPGEERKLKDSLGNLPLMYNEKSFPNIQHLKIIQESGDAIFVPSGWYHQVVNLQDTISINHNWINSCNIVFMWKSLHENLLTIENEIEHLKDTPEFHDQCQLILKSLFGIDLERFKKFIIHIAQKRLHQLEEKSLKSFDRFSLGKNQILFDLNKIYFVMNKLNLANYKIHNDLLSIIQKKLFI